MVLKAQKIPWYDEFDLEKATYARLRPLQGTVIPELFGEVSYRGNRALLLSDIGGASADSPEGCLMDFAQFDRAVRECMAAVAKFGVTKDDVKLDNYHVVGAKVMAIDFENGIGPGSPQGTPSGRNIQSSGREQCQKHHKTIRGKTILFMGAG